MQSRIQERHGNTRMLCLAMMGGWRGPEGLLAQGKAEPCRCVVLLACWFWHPVNHHVPPGTGGQAELACTCLASSTKLRVSSNFLVKGELETFL